MSSTIMLKNDSDQPVRVAIFKKPVKNPHLPTIAWKIAELPPQGDQSIALPAAYEVFAEFGTPDDPSNTTFRTDTLNFAENTARFVIESAQSQDGRADGAILKQSFDGLVINEIQVMNQFGLGVRVNIAKDGSTLYDPQIASPGSAFVEDLGGLLYAVVINEKTSEGDRLVMEEFASNEAEVSGGITLVVTGSAWEGYAIAAA